MESVVQIARIYGRANFIPPCGHPHPISGESAPITMGHEFSGVVYAVGEGVDDIEIQHVVVEPYIVADDVPTDRAIIIIFPKYELYWFRRSWRWFIGENCG